MIHASIDYKGEELTIADLSTACKSDVVSVWGEEFSIRGSLEDIETLARDILEGLHNIKKERIEQMLGLNYYEVVQYDDL